MNIPGVGLEWFMNILEQGKSYQLINIYKARFLLETVQKGLQMTSPWTPPIYVKYAFL